MESGMQKFISNSSYLAQPSFAGLSSFSHPSLPSDGLMTLRRPMAARRQVSNLSFCSEGYHNPPVNNRLYQESRYKTELCRQFEELGECEYSNRCLFAHGVGELRALPNRHPKFKTERCSSFHECGFCAFGPRCSFIHEKKDAVQVLSDIAKNIPEEVLSRVSNKWETDSFDSGRQMYSDLSTTDFSDSSTDRSESPNSFFMSEAESDSASSLVDLNPEASTLEQLVLYGGEISTLLEFPSSAHRLPIFKKICPVPW